jgi:hypothetical protein
MNEVLLSGVLTQRPFAQDTLYCFNSDGKLRWKHGVGQAIAFGEMVFTAHSQWIINNFFIIENTERPRLFGLARVDPYFPSKLFELDPKDGRELQNYWHPGHLEHILILDVDLDGKQEIILGGGNNAYNRACLAVLDPSNLSGYGPATPEFAPKNLSKGKEKYYVLFPFTKLGKTIGTNPYNFVYKLIRNRDGSILAYTEEVPGAPLGRRGGILYTFTSMMKVQTVVGGDSFIKLHGRLVKEGKLQERLGPAYWEELKNSVLYWDGERFVNHVTGNAWYSAPRNRL